MKRVELLINEVRELTGNQRYDANSGVSQYLMVRSLKNAQVELYKNIVNAQNEMFLDDGDHFVTCMGGQSLYPYPDDIYLMNIETMQWTDNRRDFTVIERGITKDRKSVENGFPSSYIPRKNGFLLSPPLPNGELLISYVKRIPNLEKRSGIISAVTQSLGVVTAITLNIAEASFDATYLNLLESLCVVDRFGVSKALNIQFTSVNSGSGVVTLGTSHTLADGEAIAVGDYVTAGNWTYNTSDLPDICEAHLIKHAVYEIRYGDASKWTEEAIKDVALSMNSVLENLRQPSRDIMRVPITNVDYLNIW